jgi:hypothetical protein
VHDAKLTFDHPSSGTISISDLELAVSIADKGVLAMLLAEHIMWMATDNCAALLALARSMQSSGILKSPLSSSHQPQHRFCLSMMLH